MWWSKILSQRSLPTPAVYDSVTCPVTSSNIRERSFQFSLLWEPEKSVSRCRLFHGGLQYPSNPLLAKRYSAESLQQVLFPNFGLLKDFKTGAELIHRVMCDNVWKHCSGTSFFGHAKKSEHVGRSQFVGWIEFNSVDLFLTNSNTSSNEIIDSK